jgi:membrane protein DedA with SNARE-associated domain
MNQKRQSRVWPYRILLAVVGLVLASSGWTELSSGHFAGANGLGQAVYSPAAITIGVFLILVAVLPSTPLDWAIQHARKTMHTRQGRR